MDSERDRDLSSDRIVNAIEILNVDRIGTHRKHPALFKISTPTLR